MKLTSFWKDLFFPRGQKGPSDRDKKSKASDELKKKYLLFLDLLKANNRVLSLMADMEEKSSGEYLFDKQYIVNTTESIATGVASIIQLLNDISGGKYTVLNERFRFIQESLSPLLFPRRNIKPGRLTIDIRDLSGTMSDVAGGKIAQLGEIKNRLNLPVPDGFVITTYASKLFLEHNNLGDRINGMLQGLNANDLSAVNAMSANICELISKAELPQDVVDAIDNSIRAMQQPLVVSVRSSAILEDSDFSFAGQYATFLNVPADKIKQRYREVVASLFTPRAIFYYKTKGLTEDDIIMAVGVVRMVEPKAAGVLYTVDPNEPDRDVVIINSLRGLGQAVVDGTMAPDYYAVNKSSGAITDMKIAQQSRMLVCSPEGDIREQDVPSEDQGTPSIDDTQIKELFSYAASLEKHYGVPQDIEWALDSRNRLYLLQSRPLNTLAGENTSQHVPRRIEGQTVIIDKGIIACKGIAWGKAFVVNNNSNLTDFPDGAVLVARHTSPRYVTVMKKASAIITDVGGITGHMASLSREYGVPTLLDTGRATSMIKHGQEITVDAYNCNVYAGKVDSLLAYAVKKPKVVLGGPLFDMLGTVLKWIVPLNLANPEDRNFRQAACMTFHDITRYTHEKVMSEMFRIGEGKDSGIGTIALNYEGPLDAHLIDMDNCVADGVTVASPDDIHSIPFSSFLKGLFSMKWPEPRPADAHGLIGMMMHHATRSETETYDVGRRSFALVARNYMNFSVRLGYHFSMIEAYAGENRNDNYIRFFFKGGGAAVDRRLRRLKVISEILKALDFRIKATEDVMNASLTKYDASDITDKLEVMGKLTVYTKQLDLVMYNDALVDQHISQFITQHIRGVSG
ncbi:MAG TPA: PEP/pyruvate-binding domain-containing protein [Nitrospirota bacterium]|nr:PEP/pyruvate-binding domain-containing protein [Nitrospirota bacterium]